jgi:hypothetical protein
VAPDGLVDADGPRQVGLALAFPDGICEDIVAALLQQKAARNFDSSDHQHGDHRQDRLM